MLGLTGDLGDKQLVPALVELAEAGRLQGVPVIGVGRSPRDDESLRAELEDAAGDVGADVSEVSLTYVAGDASDAAVFSSIAARLATCERPLVYAALPPTMFVPMAEAVAASDLPDATRLVVEKPFGGDPDDARSLYGRIVELVGRDRLFVVDHYLAKPAVENLLTFRTGNPLIDDSLCARLVTSIDVTMSETGDVEGRGSFYETVGAVGDVLQNHVMQMLVLATMDAPADDTDAAFVKARVDRLRSIRPTDPSTAVRGQYAGYRSHPDVADDSDVETCVSCALEIDDDRWRGVPVRLTTGKQLDVKRTAVTVQLGQMNRIVFEVSPSPSVTLTLSVLDPGTHEPTTRDVTLVAPSDHDGLGAYATMFDDAMAGRTRHFADIDGIVEAWRIVTPLRAAPPALVTYAPGSSAAAVAQPSVEVGRAVAVG